MMDNQEIKKVAVIGNGLMKEYTGIAQKIDSFDEVIRINRAVWPVHMEEHKDRIGQKLTTYIHNCHCEFTSFDSLDKNTIIWLSVPKDKNPCLFFEEDHEKTVQKMGFNNIYRFTYENDWKWLHETYQLKQPSTGLLAIIRVITEGKIPVLYCFSQDDDFKHYFDFETTPKAGNHKIPVERKVVIDLVKAGKALIGGLDS